MTAFGLAAREESWDRKNGKTMYKLLVLCLTGWSGLSMTVLPLLASEDWASRGVGTGVQSLLALGLALGYWLGGRLSLRAPSLQKLAAIFLVATWTSMPVVLAAEPVRALIAHWTSDPGSGGLLFAALLLWLPTLLLAMVPAYATRLLTCEAGDSGRGAGSSFGCWAFGAAAVAGVPYTLNQPHGADWVLWGVAAGAITIGGLALLGGRRLSRESGLP